MSGHRPYYQVMKRLLGADDHTPDEVLLAGIALGDDDAVVAFVRRYQRRLYGLALSIVADRDAAEDVTQEAFIRILRHAAVFDVRRGSVTAWALTITRHLAIDSLRLRRAIPVAPDAFVFASLVAPQNRPEDVVADSAEAAQAWEALAHLPIEQRRCVILATVFGRSASEIALSESIPLGTAKSRLRLAMAHLRADIVKDVS